MDDVKEVVLDYLPIIQDIVVALVIVIIGWLGGKWLKKLILMIASKGAVDQTLVNFLASAVEYAILAAAVVAALGTVGIQTTSLVTVFASAGLAIALALKGTLSDLSSGVVLLLFRPFKLDDYVKCGGYEGRIAEVGLFLTTIITNNDVRVTLPNSQVTKASIENQTTLGRRRGEFEIALKNSDEVDINKIHEMLIAVTKKLPDIIDDPHPYSILSDVNASTMKFKVFFWCEVPLYDYECVIGDVRRAVYEAIKTNGLTLG